MVGLSIFRKPYTVRQHGVETRKRGLASSPYTDVKMSLNIQPQAPDSFEGREEGDVTVKQLKSWGNKRLTSADEHNNVPGDLLFYQGAWYECISSVSWSHTPLAHYQSDFVILPPGKQPDPPGLAPDPKFTIPMPPDSEVTEE